METTGGARGRRPGPSPAPSEAPRHEARATRALPAGLFPAQPRRVLPACGTATTPGRPHAGLTRTHATHKSAAAAAFPPPQPGGAVNEAAGARLPSMHIRCGAQPAGATAQLTIAPLDLHVNPDLDLAEVGRCHHLIWSSGGGDGPREWDGRAEKAGRGRGGCGRGSGCPRPRRPGRQREREPGLRGAAAGKQAEAPGLQASGRTRTPGVGVKRGREPSGGAGESGRARAGRPRADAGRGGTQSACAERASRVSSSFASLCPLATPLSSAEGPAGSCRSLAGGG